MTIPIAVDISLDAAWAHVDALPAPRGAMLRLPLAEAVGLVLAEDVRSLRPLPAFDHSAVDGWAVRLADCAAEGETRLPMRGRLTAGEDPGALTVAGSAMRIFTGAMLPADADAVVMQERVRQDGSTVVLPPNLRPGQNIRRLGEQARPGDVLLRAGQQVTPAALAVAAGGGQAELAVRGRPRVALLSTGNEVRPIGSDLPPATVPDQNGLMLASALAVDGAGPVRRLLVRDDPAALADQLSLLADESDLILTTGGVSVGEEDHVRSAIEVAGRLVFWRLTVKPGRPVALGFVRTTPVLALPGNPAAALTLYAVLGRRLVRRLTGLNGSAGGIAFAAAGFGHEPRPGICDLVPVVVGPDGVARPTSGRDGQKGTLMGLADANGIALAGYRNQVVSEGDHVPIMWL